MGSQLQTAQSWIFAFTMKTAQKMKGGYEPGSTSGKRPTVEQLEGQGPELLTSPQEKNQVPHLEF
jgi:hypothetical protein